VCCFDQGMVAIYAVVVCSFLCSVFCLKLGVVLVRGWLCGGEKRAVGASMGRVGLGGG